MFGNPETWKKTAEDATKAWEQVATRWWDETLRDPKTLDGMRAMLDAMCTAKERGDRAMEEHWARLRLPTATDLLRVHERMGELQAQLDRIEASLSQMLTAAAPRG